MATAFDLLAPRVTRDLIADFELTVEQACGIVGNLGAESGLRPINEAHPLVPGSLGGFGYAQWTGKRRIAFERWATARGLPLVSYEANYGYLKAELSGEAGPFDFRHTIVQLKKTTTLLAAVETFESLYEKAGIKAIASRLNFARRALSLYSQSAANSPNGSPNMPKPSPSSPSPAPAPGKPWYESKAVIGGILAIVLPILSGVFPLFKLVSPDTAADTIIKLIQVVGPVAGGALAIFGRIKAIDPIAGTKAAQTVANRTQQQQQPQTPAEDAPEQTSMMTLPLGVILSELPSVIEAVAQLAALAKAPLVQNAANIADTHAAAEAAALTDSATHAASGANAPN